MRIPLLAAGAVLTSVIAATASPLLGYDPSIV
jgi:hypothetical protein